MSYKMVISSLAATAALTFSGCVSTSPAGEYLKTAENEKTGEYQRDIAQKKYVQEFLKEEGFYNGKVDADYGKGTKTAWTNYVNSLDDKDQQVALKKEPLLTKKGALNPAVFNHVKDQRSSVADWANKVSDGFKSAQDDVKKLIP